ncbi:sigma 54-interacting transcriptional regulator [Kolteria novifilia]|uniref:sigma 54-interacting transcriptional regulator n=1 Tax=Kolteria novifilia TaxID=2527975 RepID=UPI003AF3AF7C
MAWFEIGEQPWQTSAVSLLWFAMESLIFWIGWLVFRRRPEDDSAALFFLMCIVTVGAYVGGYHWLQIAGSPALLYIFALCAMALPQANLHFFLVFPTPKRVVYRYPRLTLVGIHLIPGLFQVAILGTIGTVVFRFRHDFPASSIDHLLDTLWWLIWIYLGIAGVMLLACLTSLVHSARTANNLIQKNQVRCILGGLVCASFFVVYSFVLALLQPVDFALGGANWSLFAASFVMTVGFAVSIARYRLLHVEEILQRGWLYVLISFAGGLCYYGLLILAVWFSPRLADEVSQGESERQSFLIASFVMLVLLVLSTLRERIRLVLDRRFYRDRHQLNRAMRRMNETVGQLLDLSTLSRRILLVVDEVLDPRGAAFYLREGDDSFVRGSSTGEAVLPDHLPADEELSRVLERGALLQASPGLILRGDRVTPLLRSLGVEVAQPLVLDTQLKGFLLIGPKRGGIYTTEDLGFLSALAKMAALALHGAETHQTLEALNVELRDKVTRISRQHRQLQQLQSNAETTLDAGESDERVAPDNFDIIKGSSEALSSVVSLARKVSVSTAKVLIRGESGTGKSMLAEAIHRASPRAKGPFVKVHCAALSQGLLESELFGHVKGAFTGAHRDKIGRFQLADGGTIFLDEVGDLSLEIQTKLLQVLQERTFEPVGSSEPIEVDVRFIAATHQPLEEFVREGRFREDLFYRINVMSLYLPPLRERRDDILDLALHLLRKCSFETEKSSEGLDDDAVLALLNYEWPGNIRELENVLERALILSNGPLITLEDLPEEVSQPRLPSESGRRATPEGSQEPRRTWSDPPMPRRGGRALKSKLNDFERQQLLEALEAGGGNKSKAAQVLGIPRSTFCSKLKKYGIS